MSLTACEEPSVSDAHRFATLTNAEEVKGEWRREYCGMLIPVVMRVLGAGHR